MVNKHTIKAIFGLCLAFTLLANPIKVASAQNQFKASASFYLQYFGGRVNPARLPRVYQVFEKLRNVADKQANRWPELLIIRDLLGYQVLALPDGNIIISHAAIKLIYKDVSPQLGDTRLAFMLGHELAHLAEDDFWDAEMAQALVSLPKAERASQLLGLGKNQHKQRRKETQADDKGLLYASLAGYPIGILFSDQSQDDDFLTTWVKITSGEYENSTTPAKATNSKAMLHKTHAPPKIRAQLLQQRLKQRVARVEQFRFAVRLAHFGRCSDALQMLEDLRSLFPGRALFNNIGYCRLQQGLETLVSAQLNLYWLPQVLDAQTRLSELIPSQQKLTLRGTKLNPLTRSYLDKASQALEAATKLDPYYLPAWINLASVQFLQGEVYQARASIEKARKLAPDNVDVQSLKLLILYEEGLELDVSLKVIGMLNDLLSKHPNHLMTRFNLARILSLRGRQAKAQRHWQKLAQSTDLSPNIEHVVCKQVPQANKCKQLTNNTTAKVPSSSYQWTAPIQVGTDLLNSNEKINQLLKNMRQYQFKLSGALDSNSTIYSNQELSVLDFDHLIEMVVLKRQGTESSTELSKLAGPPNWKKQIANGEIWSYYNWAAWIQSGYVKEVWIGMEAIQ